MMSSVDDVVDDDFDKLTKRKDGSVRNKAEKENAEAARLRRESRASPRVEKRKKMIMINQQMLKKQRGEEKVKLRGTEKVERRPRPWQEGGDPKRSLSALSVGQWLEGTVVRLVGYGAWVDIGAEIDGFVHVKALRDEFTHHPADVLTPGDVVKVCVKHVQCEGGPSLSQLEAVAALPNDEKWRLHPVINQAKSAAAENGNLGLSCLPVTVPTEIPERAHGREVLVFDDGSFEEDMQVWGEVTRVTHFGAFVDVGAEVEAFLHVSEYPDRTIGENAPDCFTRGQRLVAYVKELDMEANRVKLTKFRPKSLPRLPF